MSQGRFCYIKNLIHIENYYSSNKFDKLNKIRFVLDYIMDKWRQNYYPSRDLCIYETIIPYQSRRHKFTVDLRNKPNPVGFLVYDIADASNGYMLNGEVFTGERERVSIDKIDQSRVVRLAKHYLDKGHIIFADNFYTTIELANYLYLRSTGLVGTLRSNRVKESYLDDDMMKDEVRYFENKEYNHVLLTIWYDSIRVKAISNCMKPINVISKKGIENKLRESPLVFHEYNKKACGIDLANHLFAVYRNKLKHYKWWMYIFNFLLQVSINNAYIIYKTNKQNKYKKKRIRNPRLMLPRKDFILFIIRKLLYENGEPKINDINQYLNQNRKVSKGQLNNLTYIPHLLEHFGHRPCLKCNKSTGFHCQECGNGIKRFHLCIKCHEMHHKDLFQNGNFCNNT